MGSDTLIEQAIIFCALEALEQEAHKIASKKRVLKKQRVEITHMTLEEVKALDKPEPTQFYFDDNGFIYLSWSVPVPLDEDAFEKYKRYSFNARAFDWLHKAFTDKGYYMVGLYYNYHHVDTYKLFKEANVQALLSLCSESFSLNDDVILA
jgi:hypothetical protein